MESSNTSAPDARPHWGPLATLLWSALIAGVYILCSSIFLGVYIGVTQRGLAPDEFEDAMRNSQSDGLAISLVTLAMAVICSALIAGVVKLKRGSSLKDYLGFNIPPARVIGKWSLILLVFLALSDMLTYLLGKPIVPDFMLNVYSSAQSRWLLCLAIVIGAPLLEELFFRGFLIKGLSVSFIGPAGAVVVSSAVWASMHVQYDYYGIGQIFLTGLLLGAARVKTGSIVLPMFLHATANAIALLETVIVFNYR